MSETQRINSLKWHPGHMKRKVFIQVTKPRRTETNLMLKQNYNNSIKSPKTKYAKEVSIKFGAWRQFNDKQLYKLFHNLFRSNFTIDSLSFDLTNCVKISSDGFKYMEKELSKIKQLKKLEIVLHGHYGIFDGSLKTLARLISRFRNLESLSFDFSHCYSITDIGLSKILKSISRLICLNSLSLNLEDCQSISDTSLFQLDKSLQKHVNIVTFKLNLGKIIPDFAERQEITNKGFHKLARRLESFRLLKELSLEFSNCNRIDSDGLCDLSGYFSDLPSIRKLKLDLSDCPGIDDNHIKSLWEDLSKMKNLYSLSLNFQNCTVNGKGIAKLKTVFSTLASLEEIALNLGGMTPSNEIHVQNLINIFEFCISAKKIQLSFDFCSQISDQTLIFLASKLSKLSELTHLGLSFEGCQKVNNEGFVSLISSMLIDLPNLQDLEFNFKFCRLLDDFAVDQLQIKLSTSQFHIPKTNIAVNNTDIRPPAFQDLKKIFGQFWKST